MSDRVAHKQKMLLAILPMMFVVCLGIGTASAFGLDSNKPILSEYMQTHQTETDVTTEQKTKDIRLVSTNGNTVSPVMNPTLNIVLIAVCGVVCLGVLTEAILIFDRIRLEEKVLNQQKDPLS